MFRIAAGVLALSLLSQTPMVRGADEKPSPKVVEKIEKEPTNDKEFLAWAIACETNEVTLAGRAAKKAESAAVRELAAEVKAKHEEHVKVLLETAKRMKMGVVGGTEEKFREEADRLNKLEGKPYDNAYLEHLSKCHEMGTKKYTEWSEKLKDEELKKTIKDFIPTLEKHKKLVEKTRGS